MDELGLIPGSTHRQPREQRPGPLVVGASLAVCAPSPGGVTRDLQIGDRAREVAAELEVEGKLRGNLVSAVAGVSFKGLADAPMQLPATSRREAVVDRAPVQRVHEGVRRRTVLRVADSDRRAHEPAARG